MLKALLFDLDGTIANTDPIHYQVWEKVLQPYGIALNPAFYQARFSGRLNHQIIQDILPQLTWEEGAALSRLKEATFREQASCLQPMPGLLDLLNWMNERMLRRAVVTNAPRENAYHMIRVLELETRLPLIILGEELRHGKPNPLPYQIALETLGVLPHEAIAFEDSPSGIRSAVGAGISTIGIASTHSPTDLEALGVKLAISDFTDIRLWDGLAATRIATTIDLPPRPSAR